MYTLTLQLKSIIPLLVGGSLQCIYIYDTYSWASCCSDHVMATRPRLSLPPELFCESAAGGIHDARANPRQDPAWEQKTP